MTVSSAPTERTQPPTMPPPSTRIPSHWDDLLSAIRVQALAKWSVLLVLVFACAACAGRPEAFRVEGFDADEVAQLQSAADEWCNATGGAYCPTLSGGENTVSLVDALNNGAAARYALQGGIGHVWIADRSDNAGWLRLLRRSFLHELGHNAGCRTDLEPGTVMAAAEGDEPDHLTARDLTCAS